MRYLAIPLLLTACACTVDPGPSPGGPEPSAGAHATTSSAVTGVDPDARRAAALGAAVRLAATVDATRAPKGLAASDFSVQASLDEYVAFLDDIADHGPSAQIVLTGRSAHLVSAGDTYQSVVFIKANGGKPAFSELHGDDLATPLADALHTLSTTEHADDDAFFLVTVPALHLTTIGYRVGGAMMLAPLTTRPDLSLLAGKSQPATTMFASLASPARRAAAQEKSRLASAQGAKQ